MKKVLIVVIAILALVSCKEKSEFSTDAPFGFEWGESYNDIKSKNLKDFEYVGNDDGIVIAKTHEAPKEVTIVQTYYLYFETSVGLGLINARTREISLSEDKSHDSIVNAYKAVMEHVENSLNEPTRSKSQYDELISDCINKNDCSPLDAEYKTKDATIKISLVVSKTGNRSAWVSLNYYRDLAG